MNVVRLQEVSGIRKARQNVDNLQFRDFPTPDSTGMLRNYLKKGDFVLVF